MSDLSFTHLDPLGRARMVDVTPKEATHRRAVARCKVFMKPETTAAISEGNSGMGLYGFDFAGITITYKGWALGLSVGLVENYDRPSQKPDYT